MFDLKDGKILRGSLWFAIAIFIKWQPLIILPHVVLYVLLRSGAFGERPPRVFADFIHALLMIVAPLLAVFSFLYYIFSSEIVISFYKALGSQHPYLSANALNLGWLTSYFLHVYAPNIYGPLRDGGNYIINQSVSQSVFIVHKGFFILFYFFSLFAFLRAKKTFRNLVLFSLLGYLAYFEFNTGVHENHLFLSVLLAGYLLLWGYWKPFSFLAVLSNLNLFVFYGIDGRGLVFSRLVGGIDITVAFAILSCIGYFVLWTLVPSVLKSEEQPQVFSTVSAGSIRIHRRFVIVMAVLIVIAGVISYISQSTIDSAKRVFLSSFEGDVKNWANGNMDVLEPSSLTVQDGAVSMHAVTSGLQFMHSRAISVDPKASYTLRVWLYVKTGAARVGLATVDGKVLSEVQIYPVDPNRWMHLSITTLRAVGVEYIEVFIDDYHEPSEFYVDLVELYKR
ncbi:MAG: hypothetical protein HZC38_18085 [Chloroflexi bacterium]|nr:hypothetical protein [Chloroflexota bacterium]